jgi:hypothetical protein
MGEVEVPTCGKGLAANADLPAQLSRLLIARAEILERHMRALDLTDADAKQEHEAYTSLVHAHRAIGRELDGLARQMAGYHDLPMGRHDMAVMADPHGQAEAFRQFVDTERDLLELLKTRVAEAEKMLS